MATPTSTPSLDQQETIFPTLTPGPIASAFNNVTYTPIPLGSEPAGPENWSSPSTPSSQPLWQDFLSSLEDASNVNDEAILEGWYFNGVIALVIILVFILMRPHHVVYSTRLLDPGIRVKPPAIPSANCQWIWAWVKPVLLVSEPEILETAGLDALIYLRIVKMGIQFFVPVCIAAFLTLVPVHVTSGEWVMNHGAANFIDGGGNQPFNFSTPFTSISMAQVPAGSNVLWLHFFFMHFVVGWGCYLCFRNYQTFVVLRHKYLGEVISSEAMEERQMVLQKGWPWCSQWCGRKTKKDASAIGRAKSVTSEQSSASSGFRTSTSLMGPVQAATVLARTVAPKSNMLWRKKKERKEKQKQQELRTVLEGNVAHGMDQSSSEILTNDMASPQSPLETPPADTEGMHRNGSGPSIAPSIQAKLHRLASRKSVYSHHSAITPPATPPRDSNLSTSSLEALTANDGLAGQFLPAINVDISAGAVVGPGVNVARPWDVTSSTAQSITGDLSTCESGTCTSRQLDTEDTSSRNTSGANAKVTESIAEGSERREQRVSFAKEQLPEIPGDFEDFPPLPESDDIFKEDDVTFEPRPTQPYMKKSASMPIRARSSSLSVPGATAAVRWWQEFSTTTELKMKTTANLSNATNSGSKNTLKAADAMESAPASLDLGAIQSPEEPAETLEKGTMSPRADAAATHVRVVSKPRVLSLKTARADMPDGTPCRVMAELYAVLVTGVPNLETRRKALDRRVASKKFGVLNRVITRLTSWDDESDTNESGASCAAMPSRTASDLDDISVHEHSLSFAPDEEEGEGAGGSSVRLDRTTQALPRAESGIDSDEVVIRVQGSDLPDDCSQLSQFGALEQRSQSDMTPGRGHLQSADEGSPKAFTIKLKRKRPVTLPSTKMHTETSEGVSFGDDLAASQKGTQEFGGSRRQTQDFTEAGRQFDVVTATFRHMFPDAFLCTIPIHKDRKVEKLLFKWNKLSRQLEVAQEKKRLWGASPTIRINGHCCMGGEVMDAEEYFQNEVMKVEEEMILARNAAWEADPTGNAIVLFLDQFSATVAAQSVINPEDGNVFNTQPAPGPDNINWTTLWKTPGQQLLRRALAAPALILTILFPAGFFSASITQLDVAFCAAAGASSYCGSENGYNSAGSLLHQLLQSPLLPSLLLTIWQMIAMPHTLYSLSLVQADTISKSSLDHKIAKYFFLWGLLNVFLGGMLGGMSELLSLIIEPTNFLLTVGNSMIKAANFFIQFVQFQTLVIALLGLMQPHGGIWMYIFARIFHRRMGGCCLLERDVAMTWTAKSLRYGREIPIHLLIFLLGLCYSTASPGILPYCAMYFIIFYFVRRYHILYVFERCYESGGLFWPLVFDMVMLMLCTFQVFMAAVLITFQGSIQAGISFLTIPVGIFYFRQHCHKRFSNASKYLPLETADRAPPALVDPAMYVPIPLRNGAAGWHPESRKAWDGYNMIAATV